MNWTEYFENIRQSAKNKNIPLSGSFELTPRCNLNCVMCYINQPARDASCIAREKDASSWLKLAKEARDTGTLRLLLTGGEVFLRSDFREIYEALSQMGFMITIFTNGTLITPEIAHWLGKMPPSMTGVTMYGASPTTYQQVCGSAEAYNKALRGIDLLLEQGITMEIRTTFIKKNKHDFDALIAMADQRGVPILSSYHVTPRRDASSNRPILERYDPYDAFEHEQKRRILHADIIKKADEYLPLPSCSADETWPHLYCGAGLNSFWVTWDGKMSACAFLEEPCSLPFEQGFAESWREMSDKAKKIPVCRECLECELKEYCMQCFAKLKIETGHFDCPAPYLCQLAQLEKKNAST